MSRGCILLKMRILVLLEHGRVIGLREDGLVFYMGDLK